MKSIIDTIEAASLNIAAATDALAMAWRAERPQAEIATIYDAAIALDADVAAVVDRLLAGGDAGPGQFEELSRRADAIASLLYARASRLEGAEGGALTHFGAAYAAVAAKLHGAAAPAAASDQRPVPAGGRRVAVYLDAGFVAVLQEGIRAACFRPDLLAFPSRPCAAGPLAGSRTAG